MGAADEPPAAVLQGMAPAVHTAGAGDAEVSGFGGLGGLAGDGGGDGSRTSTPTFPASLMPP